MILDFNSDETQIENLINTVQSEGHVSVTIGHLGLLKRTLYALELTDKLIRLCSKPVKLLPEAELAIEIVEELNTFIRKSEETEG